MHLSGNYIILLVTINHDYFCLFIVSNCFFVAPSSVSPAFLQSQMTCQPVGGKNIFPWWRQVARWELAMVAERFLGLCD